MLQACGLTDIGPFRKTNEDSFVVDEALQLFVVADGMGGHLAGEVASSLAVETILAFIRRSAAEEDLSWPYGIDASLSYSANRLRTAVHLANRRVFRAAEDRDEYTGMGTTVVCALLSRDRLAVGNAGDSRLYLYDDGTLERLTEDDTWAARVLGDRPESNGPPAGVSNGRRTHPMQNVLTNVLGARDQAEVHLTERELRGGEIILLCSDGVHGVLEDEALRGLIASDGDLEHIGRRLIDEALRRGSRDNLTAVLVRYDGD